MPNPVVRWQIVSRQPDRVADFYAAAFGWSVDRANALGYRQLTSGESSGVDGGVWPRGEEGHDLVQLFIEVDDVAAAVARASGLGARVLVPPSRLPDGDEMALLVDPTGLSFGLLGRRSA
jgi:predicted enzyme related to lactoylglutathione lyase